MADSHQIAEFSHSGIYLATATPGGCTITITNLQTKTPTQFIDTDINICALIFTVNILLVVGPGAIVAWLLTEEGVVNGTFGNKRADYSDSIWTVKVGLDPCLSRAQYPDITTWHPLDQVFSVEGETGVIKSKEIILQVYNTRTGEVLEPAQTPHGPWYSLCSRIKTQHLYDHSVGDAPPGGDWKPSQNNLREGWMKDCGGRYLLWLPVD